MHKLRTSCTVVDRRPFDRNPEHALGPFIQATSGMSFMAVSLAQCGTGLGTCWDCELAERMLTDAGFQSIPIQRLEHDIINGSCLATK